MKKYLTDKKFIDNAKDMIQDLLISGYEIASQIDPNRYADFSKEKTKKSIKAI